MNNTSVVYIFIIFSGQLNNLWPATKAEYSAAYVYFFIKRIFFQRCLVFGTNYRLIIDINTNFLIVNQITNLVCLFFCHALIVIAYIGNRGDNRIKLYRFYVYFLIERIISINLVGSGWICV